VLSIDESGLVVAAGAEGDSGALRFGRLRGDGAKAKAAEVAAMLGLAPRERLEAGRI
jgi:hypothetical protein